MLLTKEADIIIIITLISTGDFLDEVLILFNLLLNSL